MTWTNITKPTQGDATKKSLIDAVIDDLTFLYNASGGAGAGAGGILQNGSFENDVDADSVPDGWTDTLGAGAALAFDVTTPAHGIQAIKFTTAGSTDNYITTDDFILCAVPKPIIVEFLTKSSAAGVAAKVDVLWYDLSEAYLSTTTLYSEGAASPTAWTRYRRGATPPTGAVYYKLRLYGGIAGDNTAGDVYFDGVSIIGGVDSVTGSATGTVNTSGSPDRVYINGVLSGLAVAPWFIGITTGVSSTGSIDITLRDSGANIFGTLTLSLPDGKWTIWGYGAGSQSDPGGTYYYYMIGFALREG